MVSGLYGFRPKQRPQYQGTDAITNPIDPRLPRPLNAPPTPTPTVSDEPYHSGPSAENDVADIRSQAGQELGNVVGQQTPGQIASNLLGIVSPIPGVGMLANQLGLPGSLDEKLGTDIPAHERYGAVGTIDTASGGVFDKSGQAFDPITGEGLAAYSGYGAAKNSPYVQGIFDNPFSIDSYLSDPVNAQRNQAANQARASGSNAALGFNAALLGERGLYGGQDETGTGVTDEDRAKLAQYVGQTDYGFQEHTVAPDTATNQAIQGLGYSTSGAAPAGSQFSSTGTFSSGGDDNNDTSSQLEDAGGSFVGDDPSTFDDDGGSSGGK